MAFREYGPLSPGGKIEIFEHPPFTPDFLGIWKIFEKFPAGSLLHDPMKEYIGNMKKYVENLKEYEEICRYIGFRTIHIGSG